MTTTRRRYVWGTGMKYVLNKDTDSEKTVDADTYAYANDGMFVTFWKEQGDREIAVYSIQASSVYTIEAQAG